MDDNAIVELFWQRREEAVTRADEKYRPYCLQIALHILDSRQDAEECVNDTYLRAWNAIPPQRPRRLSAFLGRITRNLALDRYAALTAEKRGGGQLPAVLEEWRECLPAHAEESLADELALKEVLEKFLHGLPVNRRRVFLQRYWYALPVREIARQQGCGESRVKMQLLRTRQELKEVLLKEGFAP